MRMFEVLSVSVMLLTVATRAGATPEFPRDIQVDLALTYLPPCSLCHDRGKTGPGTVITQFGWSMRAAGLQAGDASSVAKALATLAANGIDDDGDGVSDVKELVAGTDPNSAASVPELREEPGYGCGGKAPLPRGSSSAAALVTAGALFTRRRRR